mgnify:CR=1 FL=1
MMKPKNIFRIKNKIYGFKKTLIIAEAGSNHNQDFKLAKKLIDIASKANCDAVKFQLFEADNIIQKKYKGWRILKKLELNKRWLKKLKSYANKKKLLFGVSPFDLNSLVELNKINVDFIKIASPEIQDIKLIEEAAKSKKPVIISTGAANLIDIANAYNSVNKISKNFAFLHCVSIYPSKIEKLNLNMIKTMRKFLGVPIGFSDHSSSIVIPSIAVSKGASIIEKHITFDKNAKGPDHHFALEEKELEAMVKYIRETEVSFGTDLKQPVTKNENNNLGRRIVVKRNLKKGQKIRDKDLIILRGDLTGILPVDREKIIGLKLNRKKNRNEILKWQDFK